MKRLVATVVLALSVAALPAAAQAKPQSGTILQVNRAHHSVEVIDARHAVHSYVVAGRLGARLRSGSRVSFQAKGNHASALHPTGRNRKLAFYAKVVASGHKGLVLKLGDGRRVRLGTKSARKGRRATRRARAAGSVQLNVQGLQPGQTVLITETDDGAGNLTITIKLVPTADPSGGEDQDVTGTVTAVGNGSITVSADGGAPMTFQADSDLLDGISVGDQVDVTYYTDAGGTLVADDVEPVDNGGGSGQDQDVVGTVAAVGAGSVTVNVDGGAPMTFQADSDLLDGISVGDQVDVTYYADTGGTLVADDIEPVDNGGGSGQDQDVVGTVAAVSAGSVTVNVDGGAPMTFQADSDLLDGISVGDQVDVTYYTDTNGTLVADDVEPVDGGGASGNGSGDSSPGSGSGD